MIPVAKPIIGDDERAAGRKYWPLEAGSRARVSRSSKRDFLSGWMAPTCVAVNSGTSALHGMLAAGIGPGDEVTSLRSLSQRPPTLWR